MEKFILGIDLGNEVTKTSKLVSFASRIQLGHHEMNKEDIKIEFKGAAYTVGAGTPVLGNNRINSDMYDICFLTAIALSTDENIIDSSVVAGLPPEQFESSLKSELKTKLSKMGQNDIIVYQDGEPIKKTIKITKSDVFAESTIVFQEPKIYKEKKTIVCDIGGGTTDISQFNGLKREDFTTTDFGMIKLFKSMKSKLNSTCKSKFDEDDMADFINKKTYLIKGVATDISFLEAVIEDHVRNICNKINAFDIDNSDIVFIGGGAAPLEKYFKKEYPNNMKIDANSQFANAITYEAVGEMLWT